MDYHTKKLLGLTDKNIIFEENWLIHLSPGENAVVKTKGTSLKMGSISLVHSLSLFVAEKRYYTWNVLALCAEIVGQLLIPKRPWLKKIIIYRQN